MGTVGGAGGRGAPPPTPGQGPAGGKPACPSCRWRAPRPSPGSPSCGTAGMRRRSTALPTSATPRSSIPGQHSTTGHHPAHRQVRTHQPPSCLALSNAAGGLSLFSGPFPVSPCAVRPERALLRLTGPGIWVRFSPATGQAPRLGGHDPIPSLRPWLYGLGGVPQPLRGPAKWGRYFINPQQLVEGQASHL